jgi:hypothetical protein
MAKDVTDLDQTGLPRRGQRLASVRVGMPKSSQALTSPTGAELERGALIEGRIFGHSA